MIYKKRSVVDEQPSSITSIKSKSRLTKSVKAKSLIDLFVGILMLNTSFVFWFYTFTYYGCILMYNSNADWYSGAVPFIGFDLSKVITTILCGLAAVGTLAYGIRFTHKNNDALGTDKRVVITCFTIAAILTIFTIVIPVKWFYSLWLAALFLIFTIIICVNHKRTLMSFARNNVFRKLSAVGFIASLMSIGFFVFGYFQGYMFIYLLFSMHS